MVKSVAHTINEDKCHNKVEGKETTLKCMISDETSTKHTFKTWSDTSAIDDQFMGHLMRLLKEILREEV